MHDSAPTPQSSKLSQLVQRLAPLSRDPLGFVLWAFPWGVAGSPLEHEHPRQWQIDILTEIGERLRNNETMEPIQEAVASGHGVGKSALISWLVLWGLCTRCDAKIVVTANTGEQLRTKTWPEVLKWCSLAICGEMFTATATALYSSDPAREKTWRADAITWSEHNTEAFAGLHNKGKRILLLMDEASAIADKVWEVAEGALTDENTEILWVAFGNPSRNTGRFRECWGRFSHRWSRRQIDSRTVPGTNKAQLDKWVQDYGEDHDFVRVRVRGVFPRTSSSQLISTDLIAFACKVETPPHDQYAPTLVGVDVARYGSDESVIYTRKGNDGRKFAVKRFRGLDTMALAGQVAGHCDELRLAGFPVAMIFVDATGVGGGVADRLRQLGYRCTDVNNGARSDNPIDGIGVHDKGAEMWCRARDWLKRGGALNPNDLDLHAQLEGREYGYDKDNRIRLESKDDMRARGLSSPDVADAFCLTFAYPVQHPSLSPHAGQFNKSETQQAITKYDPWSALR